MSRSTDPNTRFEPPVTPVTRWLAPVSRFLHVEAASGIMLLAASIVALAVANSPLAGWFAAVWKTPISLSAGGFTVAGDVGHLIVNDGLMTIFFFVVGLEVKREIVSGEFRDRRRALLPVFAALGGVLVPAVVYLAFQWGEAGQRGWAIPMATDIAFVVGIIALFGRRVPFGLKILLLSLAVVDDLMAVLIIAFVFTDAIMWAWLGAAAGALVVAYGLNRIGVRQIGAYVVVGLFVWTACWKSGVHPTVAGVLLGLLTPGTAWIGRSALSDVLGDAWQRISDAITGQDGPAVDVERIQFVARETVSPLHRLELTLHPWVAFVIMPVFALANAGVPIAVDRLGDPIALAVAAGLAIGKPVGIMLLCAVAVRARLTTLPDGVTWGMLAGGGCLAGVGFTMALFLNALAFPGEELIALAAAGKIGTLTGSVLSGTLGAMILWWYSTPRRAPAPQERQSIP